EYKVLKFPQDSVPIGIRTRLSEYRNLNYGLFGDPEYFTSNNDTAIFWMVLTLHLETEMKPEQEKTDPFHRDNVIYQNYYKEIIKPIFDSLGNYVLSNQPETKYRCSNIAFNTKFY